LKTHASTEGCAVLMRSNHWELFAERFASIWARTDALFDLITPDAVLTRPISLRHPFIFYIGHLPAFAWKHLNRGVLRRASFEPHFDEMFDRGIDPDVEDPTQCHPHPEVPERWPDLQDVIAYRDRVREAISEGLPDVEASGETDGMARRGRAVRMVIEHELMHQETLLYMAQQLAPEQLVRPSRPIAYSFREGLRTETIEIPGGETLLGAAFESLDFGWDNEFPRIRVPVPGFAIDSVPVTNGRFLSFVEAGGYDRVECWGASDWNWKQRARLTHPLFWMLRDGSWFYRTLFDVLRLADVAAWPVYVSLAEARAYARWAGAHLPTEAEFHRAAYGMPDGPERSYPWGEDAPTQHRGNFDFVRWSAEPVGSRPEGASAWGVHELVGNGWEWTESVFRPFPGFRANIPDYPGYSADFFDGKHYVLKGASWATAAELTRRSFRNWHQAHYPYVFAKFRCVHARGRSVARPALR
jgi:ergothioneine biosynthesis protein EgtB